MGRNPAIFKEMPKFRFLPLFTLAMFLAAAGYAENEPPPANPIMKEVSPGIYEIGQLRLDQKARTVTFPGILNMNEGNLEYLLVTNLGSTHESLLESDVPPQDLHFAMLLLGAKGSGDQTGEVPPGQIDRNYLKAAPPLKGDKINITVRWKDGNVERSTPVEDWIINTDAKKVMERGPWVYNGSMFNGGHFLAQLEGAHAALVTYPAALINNPRKGNDDDQIWIVNKKAVPAVNTPVEIVITLLAGDAGAQRFRP
jgi:hypothetical protein